ncbi:DNA circularization protein [Oceanibacterium hippocampi]|uniref:DNA circulation N-terminal domain-containing protein n=1 Tax=Oceanibacterium hippocampi TaxID=745714 RepID=A0A1Y5U5X0_9PROT|nr:DNA circularization N-terminal domain-containing protein [Oceanibacterium hippocampi]SLN77609.1 hypothetical protein OCH7691_04480 [Oceanibacterium hippocampi]
MSWREEYRRASFRGVPFLLAEAEGAGGRKLARHDFPLRDAVLHEDLGRRPRAFTLQAYVLGADYMAARDRLLEALEEPGPGLLVHPYMGEITVVATGHRWRESSREGGIARIEIGFEAASEARFPTLRVAPGPAADLAVEGARATLDETFAETFSVAGLPGYVRTAAGDLVRQAAAAATDALGRVAGLDLAAVARASRVLTGTLDGLLATPARLADRLGQVIDLAAAAAGPAPALAAMTGLARDFGAALPAVPAVTETRLVQARNQAALVDLVRGRATVAAVAAALDVAFVSQQAAAAARDDLGELLDDRMAGAGDGSFAALRRLRAAMVADLSARAAGLAPIVERAPAATEPSLVTAYRLYGDAARADEIVSRNGLAAPGFVAGGRPLEVLAEG